MSGCSPGRTRIINDIAFCHSDLSIARPMECVGTDAVPKRCIPVRVIQLNPFMQDCILLTVVIDESFCLDSFHSAVYRLKGVHLYIAAGKNEPTCDVADERLFIPQSDEESIAFEHA